MKSTIVLPPTADGCNRLIIEPDPKHAGQIRLRVLGLPYIISFPVDFAGAVASAIEAAAFVVEERAGVPLSEEERRIARGFAGSLAP